MYKVYGPRQTFTSSDNTNAPAKLLQKRIRLVHPTHQQPANEARTPKFRWTDDDDEENLDIPNFLLKEPPSANDRKFRPRNLGLGVIFVAAFVLSFGGVYLFAHYLPADAAQLLADIRSPSTPVAQADTRIAQATSQDTEPTVKPEPVSKETIAEKPVSKEPVAEKPVAEKPAPADTPQEATETPADAVDTPGQAVASVSTQTAAVPETSLMPVMISINQGQYIVPATRSGQESNQFRPVDLESFRIATTEVSREQWKACAADGICSMEGFPGQYFDPDKLSLPVTSITTDQMMGFIDWINTKRPQGEPPYRLPRETEWIVAARGGSSTHSAFAWGEDFDASKIRAADKLIPVDNSEPVNGLFGMSDNAAERVSGCWIMELSNGNCYRNLGVVRGPTPGRIDGQSASLTHRTSRAKNIPYENIGFRLAQ